MELNKIALASNEELEAKLQEKVITSIIKRELITLTNLVSQLADTIQKIELKQGERGLDGLPGIAGKDGLPGKDGVNGIDGKNGLNGKDGVKGDRGNDGKDGFNGISVVNAEVTFDNHLVITLSDGNEIDAGVITVENKTNYVTQIKGEDIVSYSSRYDQVSDILAYKGEAIVGANESSPVWRIQKLVTNPEGDIAITWASGTTDFRFIWDNRDSLTYI